MTEINHLVFHDFVFDSLSNIRRNYLQLFWQKVSQLFEDLHKLYC